MGMETGELFSVKRNVVISIGNSQYSIESGKLAKCFLEPDIKKRDLSEFEEESESCKNMGEVLPLSYSFLFYPFPAFFSGLGPIFLSSSTNSVTTAANFCPSEADTNSNRILRGSMANCSTIFFKRMAFLLIL